MKGPYGSLSFGVWAVCNYSRVHLPILNSSPTHGVVAPLRCTCDMKPVHVGLAVELSVN